MMSNRRVFQERFQHRKLNLVAIFRGPRLPPKQRGEDGNEANAH